MLLVFKLMLELLLITEICPVGRADFHFLGTSLAKERSLILLFLFLICSFNLLFPLLLYLLCVPFILQLVRRLLMT